MSLRPGKHRGLHRCSLLLADNHGGNARAKNDELVVRAETPLELKIPMPHAIVQRVNSRGYFASRTKNAEQTGTEMITVVLDGRNDNYGYNLYKRPALSLNCMAEVLTDPSDEILFVDYNTPDGFPTRPEAIRAGATSLKGDMLGRTSR